MPGWFLRWSHTVVAIFLPQPSEDWDYRYEPPGLALNFKFVLFKAKELSLSVNILQSHFMQRPLHLTAKQKSSVLKLSV